MTDINPDVPDRPIEVSPTATGAQTASISRDFLLILAALPALLAVLGTRDVNKIVAYISSVEFAPVLGLVVTAGVLAWRQWVTRRSHADKLTMAESLPDRIATVKEK